jgi:late competence protein required for DNA uptake (superfamily II DNA/RNA helicase)
MNKSLPIWEQYNEIIKAVKENDTVIITAETGSGKSTQIPQYLYENGYSVIVTQPRRIACITLADWVSEEMNNSNVVGYHTAFESTQTPDTKILFCTDGLQMAKGIDDSENTILILDEVHEWNLNLETLIAWIRKFREDGGYIKVVLMSATIETEALAEFYKESSSVACISVAGRQHHVEHRKFGAVTFEDEIAGYVNSGYNVLAFVPGKKEINDTIDNLKELKVNAEFLPLHGEMLSDEQKKCFWKYPKPKVIVATNIAQTSVTIPDIDVVVDLGTEKRMEVRDGIEGLFIRDISKSDCLQRAGRAGRTKDGIYVLYSYHTLENRDEYSTPEIQRLNLDKVVLKLLSVGIHAEELTFFHQPSSKSILEAKNLLEMLGAIKDDDITDIGKKMIYMPISTRFARMILEADEHQCVSDIIKIVAIMEVGSLIQYKATTQIDFGEYKMEHDVMYSDFTKECKSDLLAELDIYNRIIHFDFPDLKSVGLSKKNFLRIKELITKLNTTLQSEMDIDTTSTNRVDLIRCIYSGMKDHLCKCTIGGWNEDCIDANGNEYAFSKQSCVNSFEYAVGLPKTITYKDRWGCNCRMNILTMITVIPKDKLLSIVDPSDITNTEVADAVRYSLSTESLTIPSVMKCCGLEISSKTTVIIKSDPEYEEYIEKYKDVVETTKDAMKVSINGHVYPVLEEGSGTWCHYVVNIDKEDVLHNNDIDYYRGPNGEYVSWRCELHDTCSLSWLKETILDDIERERKFQKYLKEEEKKKQDKIKAQRKKEMNALIPSDSTSDIMVVIDQFLPQLKGIYFDYPEYNMTGTKYPGLIIDHNIVTFKMYDDEEESKTTTLSTLKTALSNKIRNDFGDKNFIIRKAGVKMETYESKAAKEEFHDFTKMVLEDLSINNFSEYYTMLVDTYNDCISRIQ